MKDFRRSVMLVFVYIYAKKYLQFFYKNHSSDQILFVYMSKDKSYLFFILALSIDKTFFFLFAGTHSPVQFSEITEIPNVEVKTDSILFPF